ncbi:hypothetical protein [Paenibacillus donghaensis]|uniref:Uncharacterized protein n=1 Tax=Paenibacillus donghaensis TaxID=414771 RepID=A0A2Z2KHF4_9BACL|nr:hypothetical protein [Paenibacillus donghaensis]ASA22610.1 hypothetical protein B9T62_18560 [Paenibacillus donghaensis]
MENKRYTEEQLDAFNNLSWWDLSHPTLKLFFDDWKSRNGLTDEILDEMMDELSKRDRENVDL